jgi:hypothetical membrane protein
MAWFTLVAIVVYVGIDVLLKFLRPHYSLLYNAESDYGRGPWFWVMDLNFLLRCALSLTVAGALYRTVRPESRLRGGLALLAVWAACSGLLAFFADNPAGTPVTASGIVHLVLAFIAFICVAIGTVVVSVSLRSDPAWRPVRDALLVIAVAGVAALLLLGAGKHHHAPGGLYERIFLGLELLWMAVAAWHVAATRRWTSLPGRQSRRRSAMLDITWSAKAGVSRTRRRNVGRSITASLVSATATTVPLRGERSMSAISPKVSSGPSLRTAPVDRRTSTSPATTPNISVPAAPSSKITVPAGTSLMVLA